MIFFLHKMPCIPIIKNKNTSKGENGTRKYIERNRF